MEQQSKQKQRSRFLQLKTDCTLEHAIKKPKVDKYTMINIIRIL